MLDEDSAAKCMGRGHIGIVPLPSTDDDFEQPQVCFLPKQKQQRGYIQPSRDESEVKSEHRTI